MKRFHIVFLGLSISVICSCYGSSASLGQHNRREADNQNTSNSTNIISNGSEWTRINLPIEQAEMFFSGNESLFVVGVDGVVEIGANYGLKKINIPSKISELTTKDGGLNFIPSDDNNEGSKNEPSITESLCHPENAVLVNYRLYSVGPCEHTAQLWSFNLDENKNEKSFVINFTYSTYPHSNTDDPVYYPRSVVKVVDRVIFPSSLKGGPAILEMLENSSTFKVIWQGKESDGVILSTDFIGKDGVMLTSKGRLMNSSDGGKTWKLFSEIPREYIGRVWSVKFRNYNEGYIIGEGGIVIYSSDAGKTWKRQLLDSEESLYKIAIDKNNSIILSSFQSLFLRENGRDWRKLAFEKDKRIDDILFHHGKLFVLSESKLYAYEISLK